MNDEAQRLLRAVAAERFTAACPGLAREHDLSSVTGLHAAKKAAAAATGDRMVAVLGDLDLGSWIRAVGDMVLALPTDRGAAWRRALTRTVFLAGDPARLRDRFAFDHVAGPYAWIGPGPHTATATLCRLLKVFPAPAPVIVAPLTTTLGSGGPTGRRRHLTVATAGVSFAAAVVHLHHLLAEAILDGHLTAGDTLTVCGAPAVPPGEPDLARRVDFDRRDPGRLRTYATVTEIA